MKFMIPFFPLIEALFLVCLVLLISVCSFSIPFAILKIKVFEIYSIISRYPHHFELNGEICRLLVHCCAVMKDVSFTFFCFFSLNVCLFSTMISFERKLFTNLIMYLL